ncbi:hypothetical protein Phi40:1_gp020 [Cellulophaga phage phi40:1]|uniref:Uncharacterized protein n=1 Tax=Cellulophaga phage phi38:1 TaxID=1327977 RepID=R9ZZW1_9CAUD|nr:hypothetical protein Phi38:1_gp020 [Cellulophaga phage phi38:1]AGO47885.1 hypothetical protein Phi40:1_gp020 [Cellulophaga phage phi40:1]AGO48050.1 hypothetical protein Phi38:1_gp020 [Cellulophaga phage phi38:1]
MAINTRGAGASNTTYVGVYASELVLENTDEAKLTSKLESLGLNPEDILERKKTKGKNEGQVVYYYILRNLEAKITGISINEADWGDMVEVSMTDVDDKYVISLGDVFSRTSKDFIRRIGNLDLTKEVDFGLWNMTAEETGKSSRSGVKMYQDDEKVDYFLTYDEMPEPVQKKKGRLTEWDYSEQETFIYDHLVDFIKENFKDGAPSEDAGDKDSTPKEEVKAKPERKKRAKATDAKEDKPKSNKPF